MAKNPKIDPRKMMERASWHNMSALSSVLPSILPSILPFWQDTWGSSGTSREKVSRAMEGDCWRRYSTMSKVLILCWYLLLLKGRDHENR